MVLPGVPHRTLLCITAVTIAPGNPCGLVCAWVDTGTQHSVLHSYSYSGTSGTVPFFPSLFSVAASNLVDEDHAVVANACLAKVLLPGGDLADLNDVAADRPESGDPEDTIQKNRGKIEKNRIKHFICSVCESGATSYCSTIISMRQTRTVRKAWPASCVGAAGRRATREKWPKSSPSQAIKPKSSIHFGHRDEGLRVVLRPVPEHGDALRIVLAF